jgi:mxaK protein
VPELQFAHAQALTAAIGPGGSEDADAVDAALNAWRAVQSDPRLGAAARFNSANLLLRQATAWRGSADAARAAQALPLIELAKEQYRELLRRDPGFWDARYNLERAQRLQPDPVDSDLQPTAAQRERERAATRMRAQSLGLP